MDYILSLLVLIRNVLSKNYKKKKCNCLFFTKHFHNGISIAFHIIFFYIICEGNNIVDSAMLILERNGKYLCILNTHDT